MTALAPALQAYFTDRLITQRSSSPETIAAYRDAFRLLLRLASEQTGKQPFELDLGDLDAPLIGSFLKHLEQDRGNSPRTRNARLGAIHSFYRFAALEHPEHAHTIARVMAIPTKRYERNTVSYLDLNEIKALLAAPDEGTWLGRRDHALLALMIQTGVRVSELTGLRICDLHLGRGRTSGSWEKAARGGHDADRRDRQGPARVDQGAPRATRGAAVPNPARPAAQPLHRRRDRRKTRRHRGRQLPSLQGKRVTPHTLRHANAMLLRAKGVDLATIALWLGHENTQTTRIYEHADPKLKEQAIARTAPLGTKPGRYRPTDALLAFLEGL